MANKKNTPFSVSEYIAIINEHLSKLYGEILGEVSELKISSKGHVYIVLKDKNTGDILPATIWRSNYLLSGVELEVGMEILIKGSPEFYGPFGKISLIAKTVELVGEGALKKAYEKLKAKLTAEGLFDEERKRPLPVFPKRIGVITSTQGAVIHDFNSNLRKSGFHVKILNCRVEGPESGRDLTLSVRAFRDEDIDVLVLIRGGGSMQSLAGFNNETLVREIAKFPVPVIAGIGHDQDITLASLVADISQSTPSLTAMILGSSWEQASQLVEQAQEKILRNYSDSLNSSSDLLLSTFEKAKGSFNEILGIYERSKQSVKDGVVKIKMQIFHMSEKISQSTANVIGSFQENIKSVHNEFFLRIPQFLVRQNTVAIKRSFGHLGNLEKLVNQNNPERQLRLGYSIVLNKGKIVRSIAEVVKGDSLNIKVSDGSINSEVK